MTPKYTAKARRRTIQIFIFEAFSFAIGALAYTLLFR